MVDMAQIFGANQTTVQHELLETLNFEKRLANVGRFVGSGDR